MEGFCLYIVSTSIQIIKKGNKTLISLAAVGVFMCEYAHGWFEIN